MKISQDAWKSYIDQLSKINNKAAEKVAEFYRAHPNVEMEELISYAYSVANYYGEAAGELACEMYDAVASTAPRVIPSAESAATATYGEIAQAIQGSMLRTNDPDAIGSVVGRKVKTVGLDSLINNSLRDGAEFAWIPSGDTCPFCMMLASNGWQRASKKALKHGHASHVHNNCDCTYAIRFDHDTEVEGYDPDYYKRMYDDAEGDSWREKVNSMRRNHYAENRAKIRAQQNAAHAARQNSRLPDHEGFFDTYDARGTGKQYDIIKPRNIYKDLNKSLVGQEAIALVDNSGYKVRICYGVDSRDEFGIRRFGYIDHLDKEIYIFADETKTIEETAKAFIHEANHLNDYGNCRKSEVYCEIKAKMHEKRGKPLTLREIKAIIKYVNRAYKDYTWL